MQHTKAAIGRWQGVGLLATTMLGTGLFILPQLTVEMAGRDAMWAWALLIAAMLPIAKVYGVLGERFPHAGGPAQFVALAFTKQQGNIIGLMFLLMVPVGAPAALELTMEFIALLVPVNDSNRLVIELVLLGGLLAMNWRGLQASSIAQTVLTAVIVTIVIVLLALFSGPGMTANIQLYQPVTGTVFSALGLAVWSFIGVETMTHLVNEFKYPKRDFQFALIAGVILVGVVYLGCTLLMFSAPAGEGLAMSRVFNQAFGNGGHWIIGIVGALSGLATINVYVASTSRLMASLSESQILPVRFAVKNRYGIPSTALMVIISAIAGVLLISNVLDVPYTALIESVNGVIVVIYFMSMLSAWYLLPSHRVLAVTGMMVSLLFAVSLGFSMVYALIVWMVLQASYRWVVHSMSTDAA